MTPIQSCGIALPRETHGVRVNVSRELDERGVSISRTRQVVALEPFESRIVTVMRTGRVENEIKWLSPASSLRDVGVEIPEGPVNVNAMEQKILLRNRNDFPVEILEGKAVALERHMF